jgi:membrane fusion protein, multidrug efflux system
VEGLVPGTGSVFALLPPDNATGNFIHIVQRVPVRIALREDEILNQPLRPGLSTVAAIDIRETAIFSGDVRNATARAEEVIKANLVPAGEIAEPTCPAAE